MMNWSEFLQLTVDGVTLGCVYALIALGYTMVYGILRLLNFAHGDVYMIGAFIGYFIYTAFGAPYTPSIPIALLLVVMLIAAMLGCGLLGVAIDRFAYKPLRNAPRIAPLITALGVSFLLENSALLCFGAQYRSYNTYSLDGGKLFTSGLHFLGVTISLMRILVIVAAIVTMVGLTAFIRHTRVGAASRAVAFDREAAEMMGIDADRVISTIFFVGSAIAGVAGVMTGVIFQNVFSYMGFEAGLKGFTAAVIGGIGSIPGAMLGGVFLGLAESYADGYLPQGSTFTDMWVFFILVAAMLLRPTGLLGKADLKRA
jgi:branched-chain amino acid transport system permease protein